MDDDKNNDPALQPSGPRKRTPPTIDLTASSVTDNAATTGDAGAAAASHESKPSESSSSESNFSESKPRKSWRERLCAARAAVTPSVRWPSFDGIATPKPARAALWSMLVAGLTGAVTALMALGAYWYWDGSGGTSRILARLPHSTAKSDRDSPGKQIAKIEPRAATVPATTPQDGAMTSRIDALEKSVAALREDVTAARASIDELKAVPAPQAPDLSAIDQRLSKIERATVALTGEIAAPQKPAADDPRIRNVAAATLLDTSVRQGEPYSTALASAKAMRDDASALKPLEPFATTGIPSASALSSELLALLPQLTPKKVEPAAPSGVMDRLQQSASKLVRVQRNDSPADPMTATIARVKQAAQRNDIIVARSELNSMAAPERAPVQAWMDKVDARTAALTASKQFALDAMTALSKPAPEAAR